MDNNVINKGRCPFDSGSPVQIDLFVGRETAVNSILRAIQQVELGKPQALFLAGEYGIGKSSLAGYMRVVAERDHHLLGIHVQLGGARTVEDVAAKTLEAAINTRAYEPTITEKIRNIFARYIGTQSLFGLTINMEVLKADTPSIAHGYLPFLRGLCERFKEDKIKGVMLIFDELNGIAANPDFDYFIKGIVDENALSNDPLPLLLMLCGVEERRAKMIQCHEPMDRIFKIIDIEPMDKVEMMDF